MFKKRHVVKGAPSGQFYCILVTTAQTFDKNLFCNMKLLSQYLEENIKVFLVGRTNQNQFLATSLKIAGRT